MSLFLLFYLLIFESKTSSTIGFWTMFIFLLIRILVPNLAKAKSHLKHTFLEITCSATQAWQIRRSFTIFKANLLLFNKKNFSSEYSSIFRRNPIYSILSLIPDKYMRFSGSISNPFRSFPISEFFIVTLNHELKSFQK